MPLSRKLALDDAQIAEIMTTSWNCRIATIGPGTRINLTPMWFGWAGNRIYIYGRGQKVVNLRRNQECTIIVDRKQFRMCERRRLIMHYHACREQFP